MRPDWLCVCVCVCVQDCSLDDGDVARLLTRTVDLLRQVLNLLRLPLLCRSAAPGQALASGIPQLVDRLGKGSL